MSNHQHPDPESMFSSYIKVASALLVLTVLTWVAALDWVPRSWGEAGNSLHIGLGLLIAFIKASMVFYIFMHLKFDNKLFSFMFYAGLILAVGVYATFLATFHFFIQ